MTCCRIPRDLTQNQEREPASKNDGNRSKLGKYSTFACLFWGWDTWVKSWGLNRVLCTLWEIKDWYQGVPPQTWTSKFFWAAKRMAAAPGCSVQQVCMCLSATVAPKLYPACQREMHRALCQWNPCYGSLTGWRCHSALQAKAADLITGICVPRADQSGLFAAGRLCLRVLREKLPVGSSGEGGAAWQTSGNQNCLGSQSANRVAPRQAQISWERGPTKRLWRSDSRKFLQVWMANSPKDLQNFAIKRCS